MLTNSCRLEKLVFNRKLKVKIFTKCNNMLHLRLFGPLGALSYKLNLHKNYVVFKPNNTILFFREDAWKADKIFLRQTLRGLLRGHKQILEIIGRGYKLKLINSNLILSLGYSHLINFKIPNSVVCNIQGKNHIVLQSVDLTALNKTIFLLKSLRQLNAYKEKGIKLVGEIVILKEGKKKNY